MEDNTPQPSALPPTSIDRDVQTEKTSADDITPQAHTELVLGLVAPIGTNLQQVTHELDRQLGRYSYQSTTLRLSGFLTRLSWDPPRAFGDPFDERVWKAMDAGNDLRAAWGHEDALALLSIGAIETARANRAIQAGDEFDAMIGAPTVDRCAWILWSLKTAEEVRTLRDVYGPRFFLIGAHCPEPGRLENLRAEIAATRPGQPESEWSHAPSQLVDRDWKEEHESGQDVRGTFHQADFFIDANDEKSIARDLDRVLSILFGYPYATPSRDEYAMFQAAGAACRSAELGRQVGAAIATRTGSVLSLGTNEVPAFGGGSYWEGDSNDRREYTLGRDTNRDRQEKLAAAVRRLIERRVEQAFNDEELAAETHEIEAFCERLLLDLPQSILAETDIGDLTEFGRATHAEMSALMDAARRGAPVRGATVYTTTFPCHNCARHIVEAGIERVVYIEPYAKSQALALHRDSIELAGAPGGGGADKVGFEPFVGVAPRRYLELFDAAWREQRGYPRRKDAVTARTIDFDAERPTATPVFADLERDDLRPYRPVYRLRERRVLDLLERLFEETQLQLQEDM